MLARMDRAHPRRVDPLIAPGSMSDASIWSSWSSRSRTAAVDFWWTDYHFGPRIADALRASYRFDRSVGRYFLYRPVSVAPARQLPGVGTEPHRRQAVGP